MNLYFYSKPLNLGGIQTDVQAFTFGFEVLLLYGVLKNYQKGILLMISHPVRNTNYQKFHNHCRKNCYCKLTQFSADLISQVDDIGNVKHL